MVFIFTVLQWIGHTIGRRLRGNVTKALTVRQVRLVGLLLTPDIFIALLKVFLAELIT